MKPRNRMSPRGTSIKIVNLEEGMPLVREALLRLDRELAIATQHHNHFVKFVHGYGSSGVGGDIRIAVQKSLRESVAAGRIRACIFGEDWSISDERTWRLLTSHPDLKQDRDLGRRNLGITIVAL
ncbi:MAG: hypothetical protein M3O09_01820 [Acidobacteriota bacterium]|nr:hypothetical protein [Acidobacteriota bacterium]